VGDDSSSIARLSSLLTKRAAAKPVFAEALPPEPDGVHRGRIERALALIHQGHIYEVNLARRLELKVSGRAIDWLDAMSAHAPAPYAAAFQHGDLTIASTSPELFLALHPDRRAWTAPIKGTRPRGGDSVTDAEQKRALDLDPKEQAELWMVVDVERNDLGRVARPGTVRVLCAPHIETHRTLHHRLAIVGARLRDDLSREDLLRATLPSGSVTGAPKVRAMEVIAELESCRRGLYTGAFGFVRHDGGVRLAMAIRTLTAKNGVGHYGVGGGIVADSDPDREVTETRWKAVQVQRLLEEFRPHSGHGDGSAAP
jgi:anthranilate/para-aminobenzoate synthase component I